VADAAGEAGGLQEELGFGLGVLFHRANESPGVERLVLMEIAAVGRPGIDRREQLISAYEGMLRKNLGAKRRPGIIPNPLLRAVIGGYLKVLYTRLQRGEQKQLPALVPDLVRWSFTYYPPAGHHECGPKAPADRLAERNRRRTRAREPLSPPPPRTGDARRAAAPPASHPASWCTASASESSTPSRS